MSPRRKVFFEEDNTPKTVINSRGKRRKPCSKDLPSMLKTNDPVFLDFIEQCLTWDSNERMKPEEALRHEWILIALQAERKNQFKKEPSDKKAREHHSDTRVPQGSLSGKRSKRVEGSNTKLPPISLSVERE